MKNEFPREFTKSDILLKWTKSYFLDEVHLNQTLCVLSLHYIIVK